MLSKDCVKVLIEGKSFGGPRFPRSWQQRKFTRLGNLSPISLLLIYSCNKMPPRKAEDERTEAAGPEAAGQIAVQANKEVETLSEAGRLESDFDSPCFL